jgi:Cupin-like domain
VKRIQVERKSKVLPADIAREHLRGVGRPVIITDATDNWPARSKWTFEFFKSAYGHDPAVAGLGRGSGTGKLTTLSAYIDFLDAPSGELPGLWIYEDIENDECPLRAKPGRQTSPFYLLGWSGLRQHPELYDDIAPPPYFVQDFVAALSPTLRDVFEATSHKQFSAILIGPEGSLSALHRDWWNTHAYLAQIRGRKRKLRNQVDERLLFVAIGSAWQLPSRSSATCCTGSAHDGARHIEVHQCCLWIWRFKANSPEISPVPSICMHTLIYSRKLDFEDSGARQGIILVWELGCPIMNFLFGDGVSMRLGP